MEEQEIQWDYEEDDSDRLAFVAQSASKLSIALALSRAEEDRVAAQRIYDESTKQQTQKPERIDISKEPIDDSNDDDTTACSDLSLPAMDSLHPKNESTCESTLSLLDLEQGCVVPATEERWQPLSPCRTRARLEAMRSKIMEISDVLYTINI